MNVFRLIPIGEVDLENQRSSLMIPSWKLALEKGELLSIRMKVRVVFLDDGRA